MKQNVRNMKIINFDSETLHFKMCNLDIQEKQTHSYRGKVSVLTNGKEQGI